MKGRVLGENFLLTSELVADFHKRGRITKVVCRWIYLKLLIALSETSYKYSPSFQPSFGLHYLD